MSWYFSFGFPFWPFPLVTQQISDYYMFLQTCIPNWWWHFIWMMEVRGKKSYRKLMIVSVTQPLTFLFFPRVTVSGFLYTSEFWAARLRTGMSCQIFDSSWGRKWELQKRGRRRKIQLCIIYKASGNISLKCGIFAPYWLIPSFDFRKWISSL